MAFLLLLLSGWILNENQPDLANTQWQYKVSENCLSYIKLQSSNRYVEYNCERDFHYSGRYEVNADTLILLEIGHKSDLPGINRSELIGRSKYIVNDHALKYLSYELFENNAWQKPVYPPAQVLYSKLK